IPRLHVNQPQVIIRQIVVPVAGVADVCQGSRGFGAPITERCVAGNTPRHQVTIRFGYETVAAQSCPECSRRVIAMDVEEAVLAAVRVSGHRRAVACRLGVDNAGNGRYLPTHSSTSTVGQRCWTLTLPPQKQQFISVRGSDPTAS